MLRLLAVLGKDVSQSLSPYLHASAATECGFEVAYVPVSCATRADFDRAVDALEALAAIGCNVTIPYKSAALERSTTLSPTARVIGAVNMLLFHGGEIFGDNTDGPGLATVLTEEIGARALSKVQILGAGGAARAAVFAAAKAGAREIHVSARGGAARTLASGTLSGIAPGLVAHDLAPIEGTSLVISCLPPDPTVADRTVEAWIDAAAAPRVLDLAYAANGETPLVVRARAKGLEASDGLSMLVEQAALSLAAWTGGEVSRIRGAMHAAALRLRRFDTKPSAD